MYNTIGGEKFAMNMKNKNLNRRGKNE